MDVVLCSQGCLLRLRMADCAHKEDVFLGHDCNQVGGCANEGMNGEGANENEELRVVEQHSLACWRWSVGGGRVVWEGVSDTDGPPQQLFILASLQLSATT